MPLFILLCFGLFHTIYDMYLFVEKICGIFSRFHKQDETQKEKHLGVLKTMMAKKNKETTPRSAQAKKPVKDGFLKDVLDHYAIRDKRILENSTGRLN